MAVEGEVIRVEGTIAVDQGGDTIKDGAGEELGHIPIHAVVHDEEIDPGFDGGAEGHETRIHGGADPGHGAAIGDL